jgi:hypothetical protein
MAESSNPQPRTEVNLKIVTQFTEAETLLFTISLDSKVLELKHRLTERLPSHPPPERLRLIFLGHLCRNEATVKDMLGRNVGIYVKLRRYIN